MKNKIISTVIKLLVMATIITQFSLNNKARAEYEPDINSTITAQSNVELEKVSPWLDKKLDFKITYHNHSITPMPYDVTVKSLVLHNDKVSSEITTTSDRITEDKNIDSTSTNIDTTYTLTSKFNPNAKYNVHSLYGMVGTIIQITKDENDIKVGELLLLRTSEDENLQVTSAVENKIFNIDANNFKIAETNYGALYRVIIEELNGEKIIKTTTLKPSETRTLQLERTTRTVNYKVVAYGNVLHTDTLTVAPDVENHERELDFVIETVNDDTLEKGKIIMLTKGEKGLAVDTYENGELVKTEISKQPIKEVIKVGTKVFTPTPIILTVEKVIEKLVEKPAVKQTEKVVEPKPTKKALPKTSAVKR